MERDFTFPNDNCNQIFKCFGIYFSKPIYLNHLSSIYLVLQCTLMLTVFF